MKEIDKIVKLIHEIIMFSETNNILLIYLESEFSVNLLKHYNEPDLENIRNCHCLRTLFIAYNNLIDEVYKDSYDRNELNIKKDINRYKARDEFASILDKNIKRIFEIEKVKYEEQEKLFIMVKYNPYFNYKNEDDNNKYKHLRDTNIFDYLNFKNCTLTFINLFHLLHLK